MSKGIHKYYMNNLHSELEGLVYQEGQFSIE